jgi:hypothetical protein
MIIIVLLFHFPDIIVSLFLTIGEYSFLDLQMSQQLNLTFTLPTG